MSTCGEAEALPPGQHVFRRAKDNLDFLRWSAEQNRWMLKVPGNALKFDDDDDGLSTYWDEHLGKAHDLGAGCVTDPQAKAVLVFRAEADALVNLGLTMQHNPYGDGPIGCAHVSFTRKKLDRASRFGLSVDISDLMRLVFGESVQSVPDGA
jgi:hypothetical protein